jgi:membrane protein
MCHVYPASRTASAAESALAANSGERAAHTGVGAGMDTTQEQTAAGIGRGARTPAEIPARGWKDVLIRVYHETQDDRVLLTAAGVTYYALLSLVPTLSALVSVYGLFFDPAAAADHVAELSAVLPGGAIEIIREQMLRLAAAKHGTLGFAFAVSLAIALWSANAGMKAIFEAMNIAYDERETRGFFRLNLTTLTFTALGIVLLPLLVASTVVLPAAIGDLGLGAPVNWLAVLVAYLVALTLIALAVTAIYRWGPSRDEPDWTWLAPGTILTVVAVALVSVAFSWYTANFGSYNETYGSLGALIGFLTWMWLSVVVLLLGAELNSELEHQTAHDTTVGPDQPMGRRGAVMADTLGESHVTPRD